MSHSKDHLEQLYREIFPPVAAMLHTMGCDLESAKDIFHDAIIIYLEKEQGKKLKLYTTPGHYIKGIARILYLHHLKQTGNTFLTDEIPEDLHVHQEDFAQEEELQLTEYITRTGKRCLQLLKGFYYEGLSMKELAKRFQYSSTHSATVQKYKCIEKLRSTIKQQRYEKAA